MRTVITLMAAALLAASGALALGQSDQDHAAHHPRSASAPAAAMKKAPAEVPASRPKVAAAGASAASGGMGMGGADMKKMHDEMHKPGGMHDQMHGKDGQMMGVTPAASAASK